MGDCDVVYKIVLVGDGGVGKTMLLAHYTAPDRSIDPDGVTVSFKEQRVPTVGVEFAQAIVVAKDGTRIKAQIWDTAGQERYSAITTSHYRRASGAMLCFDVSNRETFNNSMNKWIHQLRDHAEDEQLLLGSTMLVANKIDLVSKVSVEEQQAAVANAGLPLLARCSAKTGSGVVDAFERLVLRIYEHDLTRNKKQPTYGKIALRGGTFDEMTRTCC